MKVSFAKSENTMPTRSTSWSGGSFEHFVLQIIFEFIRISEGSPLFLRLAITLTTVAGRLRYPNTMGYTHYWYKNFAVSRDVFIEKYQQLVPVAVKIIELARASGISLEAEVTPDDIYLNGVGKYGHETFLWLPGHSTGSLNMAWKTGEYARFEEGVFACCKTARKPYDTVVIAILCAAKGIYGDELVHISSDGDMDGDEWAEGRELYADAVNSSPIHSAVQEP
jgi:hypothetical protein